MYKVVKDIKPNRPIDEIIKANNELFETIYVTNSIYFKQNLSEYLEKIGVVDDDNVLLHDFFINPYHTKLYSKYCASLLLKEIIEIQRLQDYNILVNTEDELNYFSLAHKDLTFKLAKKSSIQQVLIGLIKQLQSTWLAYAITCLIFLLHKITGKIKRSKLEVGDYIFLEFFCLNGDINSVFRYYTKDFISKLIHSGAELILFPIIDYSKVMPWSIQDEISFEGKTLKIIYDLDYISNPKRLKSYKFSSIEVRGVELTKQIIKEYKQKRNQLSYFKNYEMFFSKIRSHGIRIKTYYDWWENQPIDKIISYSISKNLPNCQHIGVIDYMIDTDYNYYLKILKEDLTRKVVPSQFLCWSEIYFRSINLSEKVVFKKLHSSRLNIANTPSYKVIQKQESKKLRVLIILPIIIDEAKNLLKLSEAIKELNIYYRIKDHPAIKGSFQIDESIIEKENISNCISNYHLVITAITSAALEAALLKKEVILTSSSWYIQDPLKHFINRDSYEKIGTNQVILERIIQTYGIKK